jgi:uncharacterized protein (TIGR01244 family)
MLITIALWLALAAQSPGPAQDLPAIRAFLQVTPEFCTGGQPRPEHLAKLQSDGVRSILNLRQPSEHRAAEEQELAQKVGLKYFNIPVNYQNPDPAQVAEFLRLTDDAANRPMFIHCTAAIRVGAFWAIRRVLRDKFTLEAALEDGRKVGMVNAPHLEEFVRSYVATHAASAR